MYEVDFTGWVRTPKELKKIKEDSLYRLELNFNRFFLSLKYRRWYNLWYVFMNLLFNRNDF